MRVGYEARAFDGTVTNAAGANDFIATSGTLSWNSGESGIKQFTVSILQNNDVAAFPGQVLLTNGLGVISTNLFLVTTNMVVELALTSVSLPGGLGRTSAVLAIQDDDTFGLLGFGSAQYSVSELAGSATVFVVRTVGTAGTVVAAVEVSNGVPSAAGSFTPFTTNLTFAPGRARRES